MDTEKDKSWGIVQEVKKKQRIKALKKYAKKQYEYETGVKRKPPIISRQQLKSSFASIGRDIARKNVEFDRLRSNAPGTTARAVVQPRRSPLQMNNFFEHKDELEVYGDEGLTFFDSRKKGNGQRTGELFGI